MAEKKRQVMEDDWFIKRFLLARGKKVDAAYKMLINTLEWRKEQGFATLPANYFPAELYYVNGMFDYEPDREGNTTIHIRVRYILRCGPLVPHAVKWASKFFYDLDTRLEGSFYTVVIDFADCGLKNAEFDFIRHALNVLKNYIPACLKRILVVDLPLILRFGYGLVRGWIPESGRNILIFLTRAELDTYIDKENLPDYLGGTNKRAYQGMRMVPEGCPSAVEYGLRVGVPLDQCLKVAKVYEPLVKEIGLYELDAGDCLVERVEKEIRCIKEGKPISSLRIPAQATA